MKRVFGVFGVLTVFLLLTAVALVQGCDENKKDKTTESGHSCQDC